MSARAPLRSKLAVSLAALALTLAACGPAPQELVYSGPTMGTTYTVKVILRAASAYPREVGARIETTLAQIDREMSTYRADSALARFNAATSTDWVEVPQDLARVVAAAHALSELTDGAFDVTVGPLVDLWGFGPAGVSGAVPDAQRLAAARARVGYRALEVRTDPPALRKRRPDLIVDLNAIAPGFAVDRIVAHLESLGCTDYLVEIGGEVRARGHNGQGRIWRVAIERPSAGPREVQTIIELDALAVATSGDYRQFFEVAGRRYSHTLDPRTGWPVEHALAAVAVVSETGMLADGLATALGVLGPDAGFELVRTRELAALFIVRDDGGFRELSTPAFDRLRIAPGI